MKLNKSFDWHDQELIRIAGSELEISMVIQVDHSHLKMGSYTTDVFYIVIYCGNLISVVTYIAY